MNLRLLTCFTAALCLPGCVDRDFDNDDGGSGPGDSETSEGTGGSAISGVTQGSGASEGSATTEDSATTGAAETAGNSETAGDPEDLPPSHEGAPCEEPGASQACSDGEKLGVEVCAGVDGGEGPVYSWSACFVESCSELDAVRPCDGEGVSGIQRCMPAGPDLAPFWGACAPDVCEPGAEQNCGLDGELADWTTECVLNEAGIADWAWYVCNTPLVLSFDGREPAFSAPRAAAAAFDIGGRGVCTSSDWPAADTPWLARDLDRNGTIDGGHELFGSGTRLDSGRHARHGFEALAELDADGDGLVTPRDPAWSELLLWADHDGDRRSSGWELLPLDAYGVASLALGYHVAPVCDARGNCGRERAAFTFQRGRASTVGQIVDVHLACD